MCETVEAPLESALGDFLEMDVRAPHPIPAFDNSAMDGYALRSVDAPGEEIVLQVIGEIKAGDSPTVELRSGTAMKIMTGAALPASADAVIEVEETTSHGGKVIVRTAVAPGRNIRPAGDDVSAGEVVLRAGDQIGPGEAALLATVGVTRVIVTRRPRVALLVTGDEIVPPDQEPSAGQIRDSNSIAMHALVTEAGGTVSLFERVPDTLDGHLAAFERAGEAADLIVSSGGVAVGDFDFVKDAVERLGSIDLWRVAMQPGKPVVLGEVGGVPFLGLPGNPVSVHVSFEQFVRPALRKMRGARRLLRPTITALLSETIKKRSGRLHFVRVRLSRDGDAWVATPTGPQGSHVQTSLVNCHGVARFGKDETELAAGAEVVVEVWDLPAE